MLLEMRSAAKPKIVCVYCRNADSISYAVAVEEPFVIADDRTHVSPDETAERRADDTAERRADATAVAQSDAGHGSADDGCSAV